ncbi:hypothetical protein FQZ97_757300 [compost metagenome]
MLDVASFESDHMVIDVPYYETPWKSDVLRSVNSVSIVTEMTIPALHQAKDLFADLVRQRGSADSIQVVINKYHTKLFSLGVRREQVDKVFKDTHAHIIPYDWDTLSEAVNRGVLPNEVNSRSPFCGAVGKLGSLVR